MQAFVKGTEEALTVFECVDLLCEDAPYTFLALVNVIATNRFYDKLLKLSELTGAIRRNLLGHLFVIVLQLSYLF